MHVQWTHRVGKTCRSVDTCTGERERESKGETERGRKRERERESKGETERGRKRERERETEREGERERRIQDTVAKPLIPFPFPTHFFNSPSLPPLSFAHSHSPPPSFSPLPLSLPACKASTSHPPLTHCIEGLLPVGTAVPLQVGVGKESQCARLRKGAGRGRGTQRTDTYWQQWKTLRHGVVALHRGTHVRTHTYHSTVTHPPTPKPTMTHPPTHPYNDIPTP